MYSFAQRNDTIVVDEPLYGHFLRVSGAQHPGREEVLATVDTNGNAVMRSLLSAKMDRRVLFMKQMAHHLLDIDESFMQQTANIFLIRDPREMLPSLTIQLPDARLEDTGLVKQWQLFEHLKSTGRNPLVLDSRELLLDPSHVLQSLCRHLQIEFCPNMLHWEAGARPEDGIWAKYWYHALHKSSGFSAYVAKAGFPGELAGLLAECAPWYEKLFANAIRAKDGD
jgi:hypothetical protein